MCVREGVGGEAEPEQAGLHVLRQEMRGRARAEAIDAAGVCEEDLGMDRPGCLDVATDADTMGSVQSPALACDQLVASGFCARLALRALVGAVCALLCTLHIRLPTHLPSRRFCSPRFAWLIATTVICGL